MTHRLLRMSGSCTRISFFQNEHAASEDKAPKAAPKPPEVDSATGLGKWQTVEVNEEEQEAKKEEQRRIEMKRDRNEVCVALWMAGWLEWVGDVLRCAGQE